MAKIIGYGLMGLGILVVIASYSKVRASLGITLTGAYDTYIMAAGALILILGAFLGFNGDNSKQAKEVPIYEGQGKNRKIVGYQVMKK